MKRVAVVLNAKAGALLDEPDPHQSLPQLFAGAGLEAEFVPADTGTLQERMQAALALRPDAVIVAGGDGTVACAAQVMAGTGVPLGILPFGTMNLLAKDLGLPIGDNDAAIRLLAEGAPRAIDLGDVNGHLFTCASMLGLPTRLGRHREAGRGSTLGPAARLARATLRSLVHLVPFIATLLIEGRRVRLNAVAVTVTVNPIDEASGSKFARATLDGGKLALYVVDVRGVARLLGFLLRVVTGRWRRDPTVQEWSAPDLTVVRPGRATRVMNDGELMLLNSPLRYRCRPSALTVLVPA